MINNNQTNNQKELGKTLWSIADQLRGAMNADDFRDYMLSFLFLRYLSDHYETAAKRELGKDYPKDNEIEAAKAHILAQRVQESARKKTKVKQDEEDSEEPTEPIVTALQLWYERNPNDVEQFEKQMRRKVHYVIKPPYLWGSINDMARTQKRKVAAHAGTKPPVHRKTNPLKSTFQGAVSRKST